MSAPHSALVGWAHFVKLTVKMRLAGHTLSALYGALVGGARTRIPTHTGALRPKLIALCGALIAGRTP